MVIAASSIKQTSPGFPTYYAEPDKAVALVDRACTLPPIIAGMLQLSRLVRFCLNDSSAQPSQTAVTNSFSAWPTMRGLGRYYELNVTCQGQADPITGYFINIKHIDTAVRQHVLPYLTDLVTSSPGRTADLPLGQVMQQMIQRLNPALNHTVARIELRLTPMYRLQMERQHMDRITICQKYEFSAAHRLHVPSLSEQANRELFGKCNNPSGHGHNYQLEVAVSAPIDAAGQAVSVEQLDALVDQAVIEPLDHKHLNVDVPAFAQLNPSVENIARVIHGMLSDQISHLGPGSRLERISVWETGKTVCTLGREALNPAD